VFIGYMAAHPDCGKCDAGEVLTEAFKAEGMVKTVV